MADGTIVKARRETAGNVVRLAHRTEFEYGEYAFVRIDALDKKGNIVLACEDEVSIECSGGKIVAVDNGDPIDHTPFSCNVRRLFRGSIVVVVRRVPGKPFSFAVSAQKNHLP
jgi:hypothetical protein